MIHIMIWMHISSSSWKDHRCYCGALFADIVHWCLELDCRSNDSHQPKFEMGALLLMTASTNTTTCYVDQRLNWKQRPKTVPEPVQPEPLRAIASAAVAKWCRLAAACDYQTNSLIVRENESSVITDRLLARPSSTFSMSRPSRGILEKFSAPNQPRDM